MDEIEMNLPAEQTEETSAADITEQEAAQETPAAEESPATELSVAQKGVIDLLSRYPGLAPEDIPESVWQDFSQGRGGLSELYTRSENLRLKADNDVLRQRIAELEQAAENSRRSTNSRRSAGAVAGSIIDSVWYTD